MKRRIASLFVGVLMLMSLCVSAAASEVSQPLVQGSGGAVYFTDVPATYTFYNEINNVVSAGLFAGYSDGTFRPVNSMTRAMFVVVLSRLEGRPELENQNTATIFADVPSTRWAAGAIAWANSNGIVEGYTLSDGTREFRPDNPISRAQICALVDRYIRYKGYTLQESSQATASFNDAAQIPQTFRESVERCRVYGLIRGYVDGALRPNIAVTRAQVAAILSRIITVTFEENTGNLPVRTIGTGSGNGSTTRDPRNPDSDLAANAVNGTTTWTASRNGTNVPQYSARPGDRVTMTFRPDVGYMVGDVRVTDANGNNVPVTMDGRRSGSFTMPDATPVTIADPYVPIYSFTERSNQNGVSYVSLVERPRANGGWETVAQIDSDGRLAYTAGHDYIDPGDRLTISHTPNTAQGYYLFYVTVTDNIGPNSVVTATRINDTTTTVILPETLPIEIDVSFAVQSGGSGGGGGGGSRRTYYPELSVVLDRGGYTESATANSVTFVSSTGAPVSALLNGYNMTNVNDGDITDNYLTASRTYSYLQLSALSGLTFTVTGTVAEDYTLKEFTVKSNGTAAQFTDVVTPAADNDYTFSGTYTLPASSRTASEVPATEITVTFARIGVEETVDLTVTVDNGGETANTVDIFDTNGDIDETLTGDKTFQNVPVDSEVTLTAKPAVGYKVTFNGKEVTAQSDGTCRFDYTVTATNHHIDVVFTKEGTDDATLKVRVVQGTDDDSKPNTFTLTGTGLPQTILDYTFNDDVDALDPIPVGTVITVNPKAADGYDVSSVRYEVNGETKNAETNGAYQFTLTGDTVLTVVFYKTGKTYSFTVKVEIEGDDVNDSDTLTFTYHKTGADDQSYDLANNGSQKLDDVTLAEQFTITKVSDRIDTDSVKFKLTGEPVYNTSFSFGYAIDSEAAAALGTSGNEYELVITAKLSDTPVHEDEYTLTVVDLPEGASLTFEVEFDGKSAETYIATGTANGVTWAPGGTTDPVFDATFKNIRLTAAEAGTSGKVPDTPPAYVTTTGGKQDMPVFTTTNLAMFEAGVFKLTTDVDNKHEIAVRANFTDPPAETYNAEYKLYVLGADGKVEPAEGNALDGVTVTLSKDKDIAVDDPVTVTVEIAEGAKYELITALPTDENSYDGSYWVTAGYTNLHRLEDSFTITADIAGDVTVYLVFREIVVPTEAYQLTVKVVDSEGNDADTVNGTVEIVIDEETVATLENDTVSDSREVTKGAAVSLTAVPDAEYKVWYRVNPDEDTAWTTTAPVFNNGMDQDYTVEIKFEPAFVLTLAVVKDGGEGKATAAYQSYKERNGEDLIAEYDTEDETKKSSVNDNPGPSVGESITVTWAPKDAAKEPFESITVTATSADESVGTKTYKFTPSTTAVNADEISAEFDADKDTLTFTMPSAQVNVDVRFTKHYEPYTLTVNATPTAGGTASVTGTNIETGADITDLTTIPETSSLLLTITKNAGYRIKSVTVGTETVVDLTTDPVTNNLKEAVVDGETVYQYPFAMPSADTAVSVEFEQKTYTVNLKLNGPGTARASNKDFDDTLTNVAYGTTLTVFATPSDADYEVSSVIFQPKDKAAQYQAFEAVSAGNATVSANVEVKCDDDDVTEADIIVNITDKSERRFSLAYEGTGDFKVGTSLTTPAGARTYTYYQSSRNYYPHGAPLSGASMPWVATVGSDITVTFDLDDTKLDGYRLMVDGSLYPPADAVPLKPDEMPTTSPHSDVLTSVDYDADAHTVTFKLKATANVVLTVVLSEEEYEYSLKAGLAFGNLNGSNFYYMEVPGIAESDTFIESLHKINDELDEADNATLVKNFLSDFANALTEVDGDPFTVDDERLVNSMMEEEERNQVKATIDSYVTGLDPAADTEIPDAAKTAVQDAILDSLRPYRALLGDISGYTVEWVGGKFTADEVTPDKDELTTQILDRIVLPEDLNISVKLGVTRYGQTVVLSGKATVEPFKIGLKEDAESTIDMDIVGGAVLSYKLLDASGNNVTNLLANADGVTVEGSGDDAVATSSVGVSKRVTIDLGTLTDKEIKVDDVPVDISSLLNSDQIDRLNDDYQAKVNKVNSSDVQQALYAIYDPNDERTDKSVTPLFQLEMEDDILTTVTAGSYEVLKVSDPNARGQRTSVTLRLFDNEWNEIIDQLIDRAEDVRLAIVHDTETYNPASGAFINNIWGPDGDGGTLRIQSETEGATTSRRNVAAALSLDGSVNGDPTLKEVWKALKVNPSDDLRKVEIDGDVQMQAGKLAQIQDILDSAFGGTNLDIYLEMTRTLK